MVSPPDSPYGLSPRWRGNLDVGRGDVECAGSIPALAGQPLCGIACLFCKAVYPRAGGATVLSVDNPLELAGLSPRWRGNRDSSLSAQADDRSIPALAGQPYGLLNWAKPTTVYPRAGGATVRAAELGQTDVGLSPRWRGNLQRSRDRRAPTGPVYPRAGGATPIRSRHHGDHLSTVYPRAGGATSILAHIPGDGLSKVYPRAGGATSVWLI